MAFPENTVNDTGIKHIWDKVTAALSGKVDKVSGKGLSTNDYTTAEKDKLAGIESGAQVNPTIDSALSSTSTNAVQNKVVKSALDRKANTGDIPTVNNNTVTIQLNGTTIESFTLNQSSNETINIQVTKSDVGLNNVGNFKAVSTVASQGLTDTEKANARANIGAGTSSFSGAYADLSGKPTLGTAAAKDIPSSGNASTSQVVLGSDTRLSDSRNAKDVYSWAKASTKPTYTASEVGLGNVGNYKAVSTVADQGLTSTEKSNARTNIGAGTSNFDGAYSSLSGRPTLGTASAKDVPSSGNASTSQVVMGNDTRLSDSRPASDVSSWAKASTKPTYTASEVGLGNVPNVSTNDQTPTFTEASTRANIASGEKLSVILGKIKKFFTDLKTVAFTGAYSDLTGKPTIPAAANNGALTIQKNGTNVQTFSANQSTNVTANIAVPTKVSELTNDSGYITSNLITGVKGDSESSYRTGNVNITKTNIGLGNVGNFKAVSTVASQGLTSTEKSNARTNIGAGTSSLTINQVTSETDTRYVAKNSDIDLDGHELDLGTNGGIAWGTDSAKTTTYPTTIMSADSSLDALFPTSGAVKSYLNSNYNRHYAEGIGASGTGWRQSGIKTTVTKAGTYLVIFVANFNGTNTLEGVRIRVGDDVYSQNLINMTISQAVQINSIFIANGVGANTVITGDVYTGVSKDPYCEIICIRLS